MKKLITLTLLSLLTSCANLDFKMPINKMMSPENTGDVMKFQGQLQYAGSQRVELAGVTDSLFLASTVTTSETIDRSRGLGSQIALGLHEKIDFYFSDSSDAAQLFGLKYQFLGSTYKERKEKTFAFSIAAAYGGTSSDEATLTTNDGTKYTTELDLTSYELMALIGYRSHKKLLIYLNLLKSSHTVDANLKENGLFSKQVNGDAEMLAANLGVQLSNEDGSLFGHIELGHGYGSFESSMKTHSTTYAFSIGISR